ncbi:MAG: sigma-70 family RNA polymerase sigma factor [Pseudomonadota bacterium]
MGQPVTNSASSAPAKQLPIDPGTRRESGVSKAAVISAEMRQLERLYQTYAPQLSATLRKLYGDGPPDPDDIAQAAFYKVIERGDLNKIKNLKGFLWSTARNILRKEIRTHAVRDRYALDVEQIFFAPTGDVQTPERVIVARQQIKMINEVLRAMPERRRHAFLLNRVDGLSVAAVARELGISRTATSKHIARALDAIDARLAMPAGG